MLVVLSEIIVIFFDVVVFCIGIIVIVGGCDV